MPATSQRNNTTSPQLSHYGKLPFQSPPGLGSRWREGSQAPAIEPRAFCFLGVFRESSTQAHPDPELSEDPRLFRMR